MSGQVEHALAHLPLPLAGPVPQGGEHLVAGVGGVQRQRAGERQIQRRGHRVDAARAGRRAARGARRGASGWRRAVPRPSAAEPGSRSRPQRSEVHHQQPPLVQRRRAVVPERRVPAGSSQASRRPISSASAMWAIRRSPLVSWASSGSESGPASPASTQSRREADVAAVEVVRLDLGPLQELAERRRPAERPRRARAARRTRVERVCRSAWRMFSRTCCRATRSIRIVQPAGRCVKPCSTCSSTRHRRVGQQRPVAQVEPEVAVGLADEVEDGQALLVLGQPQPAAELLEEDRQALGRAEEQHRVDLGDVDALVVQVDDEQEVDLAGRGAGPGPSGARRPGCRPTGSRRGCRPR